MLLYRGVPWDGSIPRSNLASCPFCAKLKEHVRFVFIPNAKLGDAPPYLWKLVGPTDPRTRQPLSPTLAVERLAARDRKPGLARFISEYLREMAKPGHFPNHNTKMARTPERAAPEKNNS
jgi:hypothetical protein